MAEVIEMSRGGKSRPQPPPGNFDELERRVMSRVAKQLREAAAELPPASEIRALLLRSSGRWDVASR